MEHFDVVCVGGALMGSSAAYFLTEDPGFDGTVAVVERDPTYARSSSALSLSSIREQFSNPVNIRASQFGMEFVESFHDRVEVDGESPDLCFRGTGYLFLATAAGLATMRRNHEVQRGEGAGVRLLDPAELAAEFPYLAVDGLAGASRGSAREGSLDAWALLQGIRQRARRNGAVFLADEVTGVRVERGRAVAVELASGRVLGCGHVVNAAGPRARWVAAMADLDLPVEPRVRSVFAFDCRTPLDGPVPLTVSPEGVYWRQEGGHYLAGGTPLDDRAVEVDDFAVRRDEFEEIVWPVRARYVPQFDRVAVRSSWAGHYAYNTLDQNMVIGPAPSVPNFLFANGFSGHGLQHSPAVGRAIAELVVHGGYRTLDMTELGYERVLAGEPFREALVV